MLTHHELNNTNFIYEKTHVCDAGSFDLPMMPDRIEYKLNTYGIF